MTATNIYNTLLLVIISGLAVLTALEISTPRGYDLTYATAGNPKTPEREIMAQTVDPNTILIQLASGGICAIDDNMKAIEEELDADFTPAMEEELRLQAIDTLNDTVAFINANDPVDPITLGNPEDC